MTTRLVQGISIVMVLSGLMPAQSASIFWVEHVDDWSDFNKWSPDLNYQIAEAELTLDAARRAAEFQTLDDRQLAQGAVISRQRDEAMQALTALQAEARRLVVTAPVDGTVFALPRALSPSDWVARNQALAFIAEPTTAHVLAYFYEEDIARLAVPTEAVFYPDNYDLRP